MSYGLLLVNAAGEIQVDDTYKNYTLNELDSTTQTGTGITEVTHGGYYATPPIVAFRPTPSTTMVGVLGHTLGDGEHAGLYAGISYFNWNSGAPAEYTFYFAVFTTEATTSVPDYGLAINDSSGDNIYHSGDLPFTILDIHTDSLAASWLGYTDVTVNDADNYFMIVPASFAWVPDGGDSWTVARGLQKINSTTVRVYCVPLVFDTDSNDDDSTWYDDFSLIELYIPYDNPWN